MVNNRNLGICAVMHVPIGSKLLGEGMVIITVKWPKSAAEFTLVEVKMAMARTAIAIFTLKNAPAL